MAVPISNVTRRTVYAPSGTGGVGPYAFTFEILANTDIAVYKDDTLLTLTTHYAVTINANGTGSVLINATGLALAPVSPTQYAVVGNRTIQRTTDFTTGGDFFANTINDELDQQTIFAQQNAEGLARALSAPQTDPTSINMTLPAKASRALKTLSFDVNGNPTPGVSASDVANAVTYATNAANSATAAASSASAASSSASSASGSASTATTQATNASTSASSAATQASNASTSATNAATSASTATTQATNASTSASNASTSATNAATSASTATTQATNAASSATSANTAKVAAEAARDSALAAYDNFDDRYLGPFASNPTVDNDGNTLLAGALYFNTTAPEMRLWTGSAWVAAYVSGSGFIAATGGTMTGPLNFADGTAALPSITNDGDTNTGIFFPAADTIAFAEGGVEAMRIDSSGNLGIGTTSPSFPSGTGLAIFNASVPRLKFTNSTTGDASTDGTQLLVSGSDFYIQQREAASVIISTNGSDRVTIDSSGNLGLGVTPSVQYSGIKSLQVGSTTNLFDNGVSTKFYHNAYTAASGDDTYLTTGYAQAYLMPSNGQHIWYTSASGTAGNVITFTQAMTLDSSGNLLVGTTSAGDGKVRISASANAFNLLKMDDTGSTGGNYIQFLNSAGNQAGSINHNGTATVNYGSGSDYRLKENVQPMVGALKTVAQLKPCTYIWKSDGSAGQGFIAHELQTIISDAVVGEKDAVNEDGSIKTQTVDTSFLVATLTAAIQEQQALITQLTARITALESA